PLFPYTTLFRSLSSIRTGERVGLVCHEEIQAGACEHLDILLACEEQFELLDIGQQNPGSLAHRLHLFARRAFFRRMYRARLPLRPQLRHLRGIIRSGRALRQAESDDITRKIGRACVGKECQTRWATSTE